MEARSDSDVQMDREILIKLASSWFPPKFPQDSWNLLTQFCQVKRMIRGLKEP